MQRNRYIITTRNGRKVFRDATCERVLMRELALEGFTKQILRSVQLVPTATTGNRPVIRWIH